MSEVRKAVDGEDGVEAEVTINIGLRSTDFVARLASGSSPSMELPIGAMTVSGQYLHRDPPDPGELSAALSVIELHLDDLRREQPDLAAAMTGTAIVGTGAIRHIAEVELGVATGDDIEGYVLERDGAEELFRALATESHRDRAANPGLWPDHVQWIVGAMCILLETMRQFGIDQLRVSVAQKVDDDSGTRSQPDPATGRGDSE